MRDVTPPIAARSVGALPCGLPGGRRAHVIEAGDEVEAGFLGSRPRCEELIEGPSPLAGLHPDPHATNCPMRSETTEPVQRIVTLPVVPLLGRQSGKSCQRCTSGGPQRHPYDRARVAG